MKFINHRFEELKSVFKTRDILKENEEKISIIAFIQVLYIRSKFTELAYGKANEEVEYCMKYLTKEVEKLNTLKY